jgi:hypothetical protein
MAGAWWRPETRLDLQMVASETGHGSAKGSRSGPTSVPPMMERAKEGM